MPLYLTKFSYTPETWTRLMANPEDRRLAAQSYIESVGGKLHGFWYAFGADDGYNLFEAPDNVSMAAVALAIGGGGALRSIETTVLLSVEETMEALRMTEQVRTDRRARSQPVDRRSLGERAGEGGTEVSTETVALPTRRPGRLDVIDGGDRRPHQVAPGVREHDEAGSAIGRIADTLDVTPPFEHVDDLADRLVGQTGAGGQGRQPGAVGIEVLEDRVERRR